MEGSPQTFKPFKTEDTSSALYYYGKSMDEVPVLFSGKQDSFLIRQAQVRDYRFSGHFFTDTPQAKITILKEQARSNDFTTVSILILPLLISLWMLKANYSRIQGAFRAAFNNRYASIFIRNFSIGNHLSTYIIHFNTALSLSVAAWLLLFRNGYLQGQDNKETLILITLAFSALFLYRYFLIYLFKIIFLTHEASEEFMYRDYYTNVITSSILPFLLFASAFSPAASILDYLTIGILSVLLIYRFLLSFYTGILERTYGLLYFILYFCTVEIVPVAFLLKVISERISQ